MDAFGITSVTQALWEAEVDYRRERAEAEWRTATGSRRRVRRHKVRARPTLRLPGRRQALPAG